MKSLDLIHRKWGENLSARLFVVASMELVAYPVETLINANSAFLRFPRKNESAAEQILIEGSQRSWQIEVVSADHRISLIPSIIQLTPPL